ncbi:hypothetical protein DM56_1660 [Burkholderia mallei]|nr:hypothetical protein DM49_2310 [Burkholderia mallei]KOT00116.1 hypothetical protein DM50_1975 [Burkholderia mallei]KOT05584.1 hypothetical protein DM56_1660 [Burkholderia mallei]KOT06563.1 hypothetical protein DM77_1237 [Burkholderia mallei]KOT20380.1 hypothetical protein DM52_897 [Burkholderia mallei]
MYAAIDARLSGSRRNPTICAMPSSRSAWWRPSFVSVSRIAPADCDRSIRSSTAWNASFTNDWIRASSVMSSPNATRRAA